MVSLQEINVSSLKAMETQPCVCVCTCAQVNPIRDNCLQSFTIHVSEKQTLCLNLTIHVWFMGVCVCVFIYESVCVSVFMCVCRNKKKVG